MFKKKNNKTINLVNSMFNDIAENKKIHDSLKKLFTKFHKPYLKIALKTPNLFAYENHQTRIFLQIAIQTSSNWHPECDLTNSFIKKIKSILKSIKNSVRADKYERSNYIKYGEDLEEIIAKVIIEKNRQLKEKQLVEEKIEKAKFNANETVMNLLKGKKLPKLVHIIIEEQWKNILVLMYIRYSKQSKEYQQQLNFINLLIEISLTSKIEQYTKKHCDYLLDGYTKGLKIVAYKARGIKENKNNLSEYLTKLFNIYDKITHKIDTVLDDKCLSIEKAPEIPTTATKRKLTNTLQIDTSTNSKEEKTKVDYQLIVSNLKVDTWFELTDKDNSNTKVKLSWISPVSGKFLFVNTNGLKITDKNTEELIENLKSNQMRIFKSFS